MENVVIAVLESIGALGVIVLGVAKWFFRGRNKLMCLKEYHIFMFTNYEALQRIVLRVNKNYKKTYMTKAVKGTIFKILKYHMDMDNNERSKLNYNELDNLSRCGWIISKIFEFNSWKEFGKILLELKKKDVFGKIEVEMR